MKKQSWILTLGVSTMLSAVAFCSDPTDAPGIGVDRIEKQPIYYSFFTHYDEKWSGNFGVYSKGGESQEATFFTMAERDISNYPTSTCAFGGQNARTITNDIRRAMLDETLFNTHLAEGSYGEAWQMCADNEQGALWKRQAVARAKTDIEKYIRRSVFTQNEEVGNRARDLVQGFLGDTQVLLNTYLERIRAETIQEKATLLSPAVAILGQSMVDVYLAYEFPEE